MTRQNVSYKKKRVVSFTLHRDH